MSDPYVERQNRLAAAAYDYLATLDTVELAVAPQSNILCFRLSGSDAHQLDLRKQVLARGDFYVTSTQFQGTRWLRLALMNPETTVDDIARLLDQLLQLHATE